MPKFFKVKPEFDGRTFTYFVPDGRKKEGYRTDFIELAGNELLPPKKWEQVTRNFPERLDMFEEVKISRYSVYRAWGVLFELGEASEYCGDAILRRRQLVPQFTIIYFAVSRKQAPSKIVNLMSIETLEFAIDYYNSKLPKFTKEELLEIADKPLPPLN